MKENEVKENQMNEDEMIEKYRGFELSITMSNRYEFTIYMLRDEYHKMMKEIENNVTTITFLLNGYRYGERLTLFTRNIERIALIKKFEINDRNVETIYNYFSRRRESFSQR